MWVLALFDLPVETKVQRKAYRRFRDRLLGKGFVMLQYSVYARPCSTHEAAEKHSQFVESHVPPEGQVRLLSLTSQQFARMKCFFGKLPSAPEKEPEQLSFF
ncbi:MAG: CRISPR-associated endonuclease Cas2 [Fimbriimonadaceae bacterium]|nr:MAG: CRISPR-associated endoribonuclease Cas2 [Armatimonadetes bacterium OLB18]MBV6491681.1 CRISPR-associated endoribonuclease Cas2 [Fimbriimonadaceae bacterium]QOJ11345.1 MAG: CRISPR-associated endonuclease Cas2 [Chthonomonadaceae bacterium]MCL4283600.1 CRISPR-associated endonuclease Cas2 [Fimbriimonadaceae bacterium]MCZ7579642.1 CRISPR-associated endonuclease Cas2 [Fimbriimonadaceae bacterium]